MSLYDEVRMAASTAKHNRAALAELDMRALLLQVQSRLDILEAMRDADIHFRKPHPEDNDDAIMHISVAFPVYERDTLNSVFDLLGGG